MEQKVICIVGPTCSGKTSLSLELAKRMEIEIISADSRQFYKYLDIGTAKPNKDVLAKIPHHFIDTLEPDESYNASRYENEALSIIRSIFDRKKNPVVVGGSGLYIKALINGIFDEVDVDLEYRNELIEMKNKFGVDYLYSELLKVDQESAAKMIPQNWKRIIRALEVYHLTGNTISVHQKAHKRKIDFMFVQFGLNWERSILYKNIEGRVNDMIALGLLEETKSILNMGFSKNINSLNTVGYKEIISFLDGNNSFEKAVELIKRNTRRLAKRQLTWFRADNRIIWLNNNNNNLTIDLKYIADEIIRREEN